MACASTSCSSMHGSLQRLPCTPLRTPAGRHLASSVQLANARSCMLPCSRASTTEQPASPGTSAAANSVVTRGLRVRLGQDKREVLSGVDLKVKRGSLHMLIGPNGCGKSTLLRTLGGLIAEYSGHVDIDTPSGFVFQNPDHQVVMPTVAADVAFGLGRYSMQDEDVQRAVSASLTLVNMSDYTYRATHTLSGGQRQRVAIAGALAEDPKLLLLDELTTFLDVEDQFGVLDAVRNITASRGDVTAIWVTHRFEELEYADSASYMSEGKIVFTGRPRRMREFLKTLGAPVDVQEL